MSTEFYNRNWRMPNSFNGSEDNNSKFSNYSMSFDGSSEYIDLGSGFTTTNQFTISAWINPNNLTSSGYGYLLGNNSANGTGFSLDEGGGAAGAGKFYLYTGTGSISVISNTALTINNWFYVVFVCDKTVGTKGEIKFYLNGSLDKTTTLSNQDLNSLTSLEYIGYSPSHYINAKLDHFSIFDYALTQAQITALYGSSSTGVGNPMAITGGRKPVAYYPIGDYSAFNGEYLVPNSAVSDYVFDFTATTALEGINIPKQSSIEPTVFTLSCWIKSESSQSAYAYPVYKESSNSAHVAYGFYLNGSSTIATTVTQNGVVSSDNIGDLRDNKWHHIVQSFDGSEMKVYLDGFQSGTTKTLTGDVSYRTGSSSRNDLCLGKASYSASGYFNFKGDISNVSLFNTALPATGTESVASLYNYGTPPDISSYSGLQGWWKLDASATFDGSNWSIPDSRSNSNTGTSSGMTASNLVQSNLNILSPYSRYALNFDGINDYINCGNSTNLRITPNLTVSAWFKTSTSQIGKFINRDGLASGTRDYALYQNGTNLQFWVSQSGNITETVLTSTGFTANDGNWHQAVGVCNGTNIELYIDGVLNVSGTNSISGINTSTYINEIGSRTTGTGNHFSGSLSNVSLWNAALTSAQVKEIYNNGLPSNLKNHSSYSNLVSWWTLGENSSFNSNWTVLNEISTGPNGVSVNMAEDDLVNGVGTSGNGISSGMSGGNNIVGQAPFSDSNALSINMPVTAKSTSVPS